MVARGQKINDRYQIIRLIGEGGMANVYLAHDTILDRDVAVKILRGDLAGDEKFVKKFQREAISASSLNHPNIVELYDVGEDNGEYFIVMEYVEGKTLKSLIKKRGALTLPEVVDIMLQLTSAIAHAHDSYIIHRDIKPQNVLILDNGMVKITDFGIATALNNHELTETNSIMGSVHYLPPEQANGNGATVKSDIYSLGILMFELLTGRVPFKGDNAVEIAIKQMKTPIPSVRKYNEDIPQSVENVILRACAKNPKNRYDSAREMHDDLKTVLSPEREDEEKWVYLYPENELEETKKLSREELNKGLLDELENEEESRSKRKKDKKDKKLNTGLMIAGSIFATLVIVFIAIFLLIPKITGGKEVKVPDVSKMTVEKAKEKLEDVGLEVTSKDVKQANDKVKKGRVIKTSPEKGRSVKKGTKIQLYVSTGTNKVEVEDYTGMNYYEVEAMLKASDINVERETREYAESDTSVKAGTIVGQSVDAGEELEKGDTIVLYVPEFYAEYPDFIGENYTISQVEAWANKHGVTLEKNYRETDDVEPNMILSQSRAAGTKVNTSVTLTVTVSKKSEKASPSPSPTTTPSTTPSPTTSATPTE